MSRNFDAASGLPVTDSARRALSAALDHGWADPGRLHRDGRLARQLLDAARAAVAGVLGVLPQEVSFTTSGTHAGHLAVLGLARGRRRAGRSIVTSAVEHSGILRAADWANPDDGPRIVPVDSQGRLDVAALRRCVRAGGVALVAVQHANQEVGTVQPLGAVHEITAAAEVPLVVDACASLGHMPMPGTWDVLFGSSHKWGGPAGVGVLAIRSGVRWRSPWPTDEAGRPAGFPDIPAVVAAATALEEAVVTIPTTLPRRDVLIARLRQEVPRLADDVLVLGSDVDRAPHIACFTIVEADGERLVGELDRLGFAVSSGSACSADTRRPSHVLAAMGAMTHGSLRVSLAPEVSERDVAEFLAVLPSAISAARRSAEAKAGG